VRAPWLLLSAPRAGVQSGDAAACADALRGPLQSAALLAAAAYPAPEPADATSGAIDVAQSDAALDAADSSPLVVGPPPPGARSWAPEDVIGACRTTVLRGESDFRLRASERAASNSGGEREPTKRDSVHIVGCHESTVYVLAPLQHVLISNCGYSTFVVRPWPRLPPREASQGPALMLLLVL
jgi:hypothetical protein